eukprot:359671-Chlamydomonas_euryale.AAC.2
MHHFWMKLQHTALPQEVGVGSAAGTMAVPQEFERCPARSCQQLAMVSCQPVLSEKGNGNGNGNGNVFGAETETVSNISESNLGA